MAGDVDAHSLSAIQRATAAGICAALDLVAEQALPQRGFVGQENIALAALLANRHGSIYAAPQPDAGPACAPAAAGAATPSPPGAAWPAPAAVLPARCRAGSAGRY